MASRMYNYIPPYHEYLSKVEKMFFLPLFHNPTSGEWLCCGVWGFRGSELGHSHTTMKLMMTTMITFTVRNFTTAEWNDRQRTLVDLPSLAFASSCCPPQVQESLYHWITACHIDPVFDTVSEYILKCGVCTCIHMCLCMCTYTWVCGYSFMLRVSCVHALVGWSLTTFLDPV